MGEIHTIEGAITGWKYKQQKTVTQLSTESEYITLLESAKEKKFIQMLLQEIADIETP